VVVEVVVVRTVMRTLGGVAMAYESGLLNLSSKLFAHLIPASAGTFATLGRPASNRSSLPAIVGLIVRSNLDSYLLAVPCVD